MVSAWQHFPLALLLSALTWIARAWQALKQKPPPPAQPLVLHAPLPPHWAPMPQQSPDYTCVELPMQQARLPMHVWMACAGARCAQALHRLR